MVVGQLIADRYELKNVVGTGGMSSVYCAHDTLLERDVALKILHEHYSEDDEYVERFRHEARAAAQLSHPGIVTVIDRGEQDGRQFIVFEFVDGETLKDLVDRGGPMPVRRVLELGLETGRAIAFAHQQGLIHRDIKPQNILLNEDGRAQVTDFGIARSLDAVGHTETGTVLGTSHYIAPEQARGERVDAQTDVYSFGVVLYELLAGEVPYNGDNFLTVAMRHVNDPVPRVLDRRPDAPLRLASLVERCMAKESAGRPASMDEVVAELGACLAELDGKSGGDATMISRAPVAKKERRPRRERTPTRGEHRRRRVSPLLLALLGLLVLAAVIGAIVLAGGGDDPGTADPGSDGTPAIQVSSVASYDPFGDDGAEHPEAVASATDGDRATYWTTSTYQDFSATKEGVGLVLDAGDGGGVSSFTVASDTPGYTAEIRSGETEAGPFETVVAGSQAGSGRTTWELDEGDARFYALWITDMEPDSAVRINEITGR